MGRRSPCLFLAGALFPTPVESLHGQTHHDTTARRTPPAFRRRPCPFQPSSARATPCRRPRPPPHQSRQGRTHPQRSHPHTRRQKPHVHRLLARCRPPTPARRRMGHRNAADRCRLLPRQSLLHRFPRPPDLARRRGRRPFRPSQFLSHQQHHLLRLPAHVRPRQGRSRHPKSAAG